MKKFIFLLPIFLGVFLANGQSTIEWEDFNDQTYGIDFLLPKGSVVQKESNGAWETVYAKSPSELVELHFMAVKEDKSVSEGKAFATSRIGIPNESFNEIDQRRTDDLTLTLYYAEGILTQNEHQSVVYMILARHNTKNISYIITLYTDKETFESNKEAFTFWYESIKGI